MKRYILIAKQKPGIKYAFTDADDRAAFMKTFGAWTSGLAKKNQFIAADELPSSYKKIEQHGNSFKVIDGPYAETKELLTGFFLIRAEDMNAAAEIAKACPVLRFDDLEVYELEGAE